MNQLLKTLLIIVAGIVGVIVFASVALFLFFDPNDYRDEISAGVKEVTGRDLTTRSQLNLSAAILWSSTEFLRERHWAPLMVTSCFMLNCWTRAGWI